MDKISVIVPVYNVEPYLDRCIQSIVNQTYTNLEIILVDDGSPDNCGAICDAWAARDARIKVIHKKNEGSGEARNAGLNLASGELIAFVDSDDFISPEMYQHLHSLLVDRVDIAECSHLETSDDYVIFTNRSTTITVSTYTPSEAMLLHISDTIFRQLVWNKLYSKKCIGNIRFPNSKKIDDEFWTYQVLGNSQKLAHSDKICYAYRQQCKSVMHTISIGHRIQAIEAKVQRHLYILKHFPLLAPDSLKNLWCTCLYQGQLALREMDDAGIQQVMLQVQNTLREHPISSAAIKKCSLKEKIWIIAARIDFIKTCYIRNKLKIGL